MLLLNSFLFCGLLSMIAQIVLDNTKLTPAHVTSTYVVLGVLLDSFHIYDKLMKIIGAGANIPIISFGHLLAHASLKRAKKQGLIGIFIGMFDLTSAGITAAIVFAFIFSFIFKPRD